MLIKRIENLLLNVTLEKAAETMALPYPQYLNCKILHGGTLLQPWPNEFGMRKYFSEDYVIPSPKLNEHQKKGLRQKLKWFFAKIRWRIRSFLSDHPALKSRWGTPKSRWGTQNLDGGTLTLDGGCVPPLQFKYRLPPNRIWGMPWISRIFFLDYPLHSFVGTTRCATAHAKRHEHKINKRNVVDKAVT